MFWRASIKNLIVSFFFGALCSQVYGQSMDLFSLKADQGLSQLPSSSASANAKSIGLVSNSVAKTQPEQIKQEPQQALSSDIFGANLFTGAFAKQSPGRFSPDYALMVGDQIQIRLWGGFDFEGIVEVDPKGNIFLPHVGPVTVLGVANQALQATVDGAVRRVFRANVSSYASLTSPQPVRVFVGGFVIRPGLYNGTSMDSLLSYLDQAGGIDPQRGSFLSVVVKRGNHVRATVNLYDFLLKGQIPLVQLAEGDVIFVQPKLSTVKVGGSVANSKVFEFFGERESLSNLIAMAKPRAEVTNVLIVRNTGEIVNTEYYALPNDKSKIYLNNGDTLEFTADKRRGSITVRVEGEHQSAQEYVLPYGTRYGELIKKIQFSDRSEADKPQLFRRSVKERQKQILAVALKTLENSVLTARSGTASEAALRAEEATLIFQWVDRAKSIEPSGRVLIAKAENKADLLLENGDIVKIPVKDGLVLVGGEVVFPNAIAFNKNLDMDDYIGAAGGYTQNADTSKIIVAHRDGGFEEGKRAEIQSGDEILVLPKVDIKSREIAKDLMQMIYQIAIAARVVIGL